MIHLPVVRSGPARALTIRLGAALALIFGAVGVIYLDRYGYRDVNGDGLTLLDCFYYAVVSLSTTGYGDITPVTENARLVNVLLIPAPAIDSGLRPTNERSWKRISPWSGR